MVDVAGDSVHRKFVVRGKLENDGTLDVDLDLRPDHAAKLRCFTDLVGCQGDYKKVIT